MDEQRVEQCAGCGEPTGRAGIHDDSNYLDNGDGPYCDECFAPRRIGELERERDEARAEVERLRMSHESWWCPDCLTKHVGYCPRHDGGNNE